MENLIKMAQEKKLQGLLLPQNKVLRKDFQEVVLKSRE
jgi:hypothetical protein